MLLWTLNHVGWMTLFRIEVIPVHSKPAQRGNNNNNNDNSNNDNSSNIPASMPISEC